MFVLTPRLTLRPGWPEDSTRLAEAVGQDQLAAYLATTPWRDVPTFLSQPHAASEPALLIFERLGDHRFIGGIAITRAPSDGHQVSLWLSPAARGRGYATEALQAMVQTARHTLGLRRLVAAPHGDYPAGRRALHRVGFRQAHDGALTLDLTVQRPVEMPVAA